MSSSTSASLSSSLTNVALVISETSKKRHDSSLFVGVFDSESCFDALARMRSTHDSDDDSDDAQASLACSIHSLSLFFREEDFDAFAVAAPPEAAAAAVFVARLLPLVFVFVSLLLFFSVVAEEVSKDDDDDKSRRRLILRTDLDENDDVFPNPF
jgi:hypothetical protein